MNLSIKDRFLFLSNPKSGSSTFRFVLDEFSDITPYSIIRGADNEQSSKDLRANSLNLLHINAHEVRQFIKQSDLHLEWDIAYKFTTIRNPFKRMVSWYVFLRPDKNFQTPFFGPHGSENPDYDGDSAYHHHFNDFLDWAYQNDRFLPNYKFFCCDWDTGEQIVDDVFKIEEINNGEFHSKFQEKTKIILPNPLPRILPDFKPANETTYNTSFKGDPYALYNDNSINIIEDYFKVELEKFNYEFGQ